MLKICVTLLVLLSLFSFSQAETKIVGGTVATTGQFPYIVRLFVKIGTDGNGGFCDGSIIDEYHVVTAAHCLQPPFRYWPYDIQVNYGAVNINETQVTYPISFQVHPEYSNTLAAGNGTILNDVALLRFQKPFVFSTTVAKIDFIDEDDVPDEGDDVIVSGYGTTESGNVSPTLLWISIPIQDLDTCEDDFGYSKLDEDQHVCAGGDRPVHSACPGDSGGPLVAGNSTVPSSHKLLGLVSYGSSDCSVQRPAIFASVPGFAAEWVQDQIASRPNCRDQCRTHFFVCRVLGILPQSHNEQVTTCRDIRRRCNKSCTN